MSLCFDASTKSMFDLDAVTMGREVVSKLDYLQGNLGQFSIVSKKVCPVCAVLAMVVL